MPAPLPFRAPPRPRPVAPRPPRGAGWRVTVGRIRGGQRLTLIVYAGVAVAESTRLVRPAREGRP